MAKGFYTDASHKKPIRRPQCPNLTLRGFFVILFALESPLSLYVLSTLAFQTNGCNNVKVAHQNSKKTIPVAHQLDIQCKKYNNVIFSHYLS